MRSRVLRIMGAGVAGLGLATVWTVRLSTEPDSPAGVPVPASVKAANARLASLAPGDIRWIDPQGSTSSIPLAGGRSASDAIALISPETGKISKAPPDTAAYAPADGLGDASSTVLAPTLPPLAFDAATAQAALKFYRAGDLAKGDEEASRIRDDAGRLTLEWAAIHLQAQRAGFTRIRAFLDAHPDWAGAATLRRRAEQALFSDRKRALPGKDWFGERGPTSVPGKLALARAELAEGRKTEAAARVAGVWRKEELSGALETLVLKEFGELLTAADHKFRSDRLFYKEKEAASLRAAGLAGADVVALAKARAAASTGAKAAEKAIAAVPKALQKDPTLLFALEQKARHDGNLTEALQYLGETPRDAETLVDGDAWWVERRLLARRLVDTGDAPVGYTIAADQESGSNETRLDAAFHAGWIALRFLEEPSTAIEHFTAGMRLAEAPISKARFAYWLARAHEGAGQPDDAKANYLIAAASPAVYYGQLARARLGIAETAPRMPEKVALGDDRAEAIRVVEALLSLGESDMATGLSAEAAKTLTDEAQLAALAQTMIDARNARGTLMVGKLAAQRGFSLDAAAFPTFGIPAFEPAVNSAETPLVYAIARQESAFQANAVSSAGARGLMQMIASTARRTAQRVGVPFDPNRMTTDPAFNARLGAAHLGDLMAEHNGSLILTFAAYNAGGKRVKEWIAAYGDPRKADVDPIDWIERIPFTETRNYVQRVAENLEMYRVQFGANARRLVETDLRTVAARF